ncbi:unnamed protein product [Rotaria sordida]|uniref:Uncharacterized protein n=1 Tax=Rotaria sordida TaxID=392033 RepID=A0A814Z3J2_9BILA|nr:unnamed protein product [Rotaria sordida]
MLGFSSVEPKDTQSNAPNVTWQHIWHLSEIRDALSGSSFVAIPNEILLSSTKLYSKSFKQIYMDWMHGKCLHNKRLRRITLSFRTSCALIPPPVFPTRPTGKYNLESIGGFTQHPNSSSTM